MSQAPRAAIVRRFFEEGSRYVEGVLQENERLRLEIAQLHAERRATTGEELERVREQFRLATEDADSVRAQLADLRSELDRLAAENREFANGYVSMEGRLASLSALYAASLELHASLEMKEVLQSLQEIVVNLLGSESFAIYLIDEKGKTLKVAQEVDVPAVAPRTLAVGQGAIGSSVLNGEAWVQVDAEAPGDPQVVVPLRVREQVVGAIAIYAFLPQKGGALSSLDAELFGLLSAQAATALHGATLYSKEARRAATYETLVELVRGARPTKA